MLPDSYRFPPGATEPLVGVTVAFPVPLDLLGPVPGVGPMLTGSVLGASVPEAPIDEDGNLGSRKHDIGLAPKAWQGTSVHKVAKSPAMQLTT